MVQALRDLLWLEQNTSIRLFEWQRRAYLAAALGVPLVLVGGRRGGWNTIRRLIAIGDRA